MWHLLDRRKFCTLLVTVAVLCLSGGMLLGSEREVSIERQSVVSSNLASVGYSAARRVLEIEFRNGSIYRYFAVPVGVFDALMKAESKGRYFMGEVRGKYEFARVHPPTQ